VLASGDDLVLPSVEGNAGIVPDAQRRGRRVDRFDLSKVVVDHTFDGGGGAMCAAGQDCGAADDCPYAGVGAYASAVLRTAVPAHSGAAVIRELWGVQVPVSGQAEVDRGGLFGRGSLGAIMAAGHPGGHSCLSGVVDALCGVRLPHDVVSVEQFRAFASDAGVVLRHAGKFRLMFVTVSTADAFEVHVFCVPAGMYKVGSYDRTHGKCRVRYLVAESDVLWRDDFRVVDGYKFSHWSYAAVMKCRSCGACVDGDDYQAALDGMGPSALLALEWDVDRVKCVLFGFTLDSCVVLCMTRGARDYVRDHVPGVVCECVDDAEGLRCRNVLLYRTRYKEGEAAEDVAFGDSKKMSVAMTTHLGAFKYLDGLFTSVSSLGALWRVITARDSV